MEYRMKEVMDYISCPPAPTPNMKNYIQLWSKWEDLCFKIAKHNKKVDEYLIKKSRRA